MYHLSFCISFFAHPRTISDLYILNTDVVTIAASVSRMGTYRIHIEITPFKVQY